MRYLLLLLAMLLTACGADDSAQPAPTPTPVPTVVPLCNPDAYTEPCRGLLDEPENVDGTPYTKEQRK